VQPFTPEISGGMLRVFAARINVAVLVILTETGFVPGTGTAGNETGAVFGVVHVDGQEQGVFLHRPTAVGKGV
jgi:hypothetical protein